MLINANFLHSHEHVTKFKGDTWAHFLFSQNSWQGWFVFFGGSSLIFSCYILSSWSIIVCLDISKFSVHASWSKAQNFWTLNVKHFLLSNWIPGILISLQGRSMLIWSPQLRIQEALLIYFHLCMSQENVSFYFCALSLSSFATFFPFYLFQNSSLHSG